MRRAGRAMALRAASGALAVLAPLCVTPVQAQTADVGGYGHRTQTESPQDVAVELRVGRYVPLIDEEFGGDGPYERMFGTKNRYSIGVEVDWQALRIPYVGTLGPGFGLQYTKLSGRGFQTDAPSVRAEEETSLTLFPMYAVGVLRVDVLSRTTPVPLVPYGKLGLGAALWSVGDGDGTARADDNSVGRGTSYGLQMALGGMLLLDVFEPDAAVELDATMGVNSSYVFLEWYVSDLDGFGSGDQMQVGTNTWVLGLALEM